MFSPYTRLRCTNKTCFAGVGTIQKTIFRIRICFLSYHANQKEIQTFLSADQTSTPVVSQVFPVLEMEFDFCFAIENSRSFKTAICSTNSSRHCLSRDTEHIRLTAFHWCCDEVEMRGTCLEAQKSIQTKVVINS